MDAKAIFHQLTHQSCWPGMRHFVRSHKMSRGVEGLHQFHV